MTILGLKDILSHTVTECRKTKKKGIVLVSPQIHRLSCLLLKFLHGQSQS